MAHLGTMVTKYNGSTGEEPADADVVQGELAVNTADGRLWVGHSSGLFEIAPKVLPSVNTLTFNGTASAATYSVVHSHYTSNSSSQALFARFQDADTTQVGSITHNQYATAYNTSSDYRLKEDVQNIDNATSRLLDLKPCNFQWKGSDDRQDGFIAHELAEVIPVAVVGEKDGMLTEQYEVSAAVDATFDDDNNELTPVVAAVMGEREVPHYQGIDQAKIVPLLVATVQELEARIKALES